MPRPLQWSSFCYCNVIVTMCVWVCGHRPWHAPKFIQHATAHAMDAFSLSLSLSFLLALTAAILMYSKFEAQIEWKNVRCMPHWLTTTEAMQSHTAGEHIAVDIARNEASIWWYGVVWSPPDPSIRRQNSALSSSTTARRPKFKTSNTKIEWIFFIVYSSQPVLLVTTGV